jgi:hypothetical protein
MFICKVSFSGKVLGVKGKTIELTDQEIIKDLLDAGYIEEIKKAPSTNNQKKDKEKETE